MKRYILSGLAAIVLAACNAANTPINQDCLSTLRRNVEAKEMLKLPITTSERLLKLSDEYYKRFFSSVPRNLSKEEIDEFAAYLRKAYPDLEYSYSARQDMHMFRNPDPEGYIAIVYIDATGGIGQSYNNTGQCR